MRSETPCVTRVRQTFENRGDTLVVDSWMEPGGALPAHMHPQQEERWSVVEGHVRFRLGDDVRVIGRPRARDPERPRATPSLRTSRGYRTSGGLR